MKVNPKQKEIILLISSVIKKWFESNDINSQTLYTLIDLEIDRMEYYLEDDEIEYLNTKLTELLDFIKKFEVEGYPNEI